MFAGAGNDTVDGGVGDDLLVGGTGNDTFFGGGDNDTYLFVLNDGIDTINEDGEEGGAGIDQIMIATRGGTQQPQFPRCSGRRRRKSRDRLQWPADHRDQRVHRKRRILIVESLTFFGGASYLGYDLGSSTYTIAGSGTDMIRAGDNGANFTGSSRPGSDLRQWRK